MDGPVLAALADSTVMILTVDCAMNVVVNLVRFTALSVYSRI